MSKIHYSLLITIPKASSLVFGLAYNGDTNRILGTALLRKEQEEEGKNTEQRGRSASELSKYNSVLEHVRHQLPLPNTYINTIELNPITFASTETGVKKIEEIEIIQSIYYKPETGLHYLFGGKSPKYTPRLGQTDPDGEYHRIC